MAGIIGTGAALKNSALGGLMNASQLEAQRNMANDQVDAKNKMAEKQRTSTAVGIGAYAAPKLANAAAQGLAPEATSLMVGGSPAGESLPLLSGTAGSGAGGAGTGSTAASLGTGQLTADTGLAAGGTASGEIGGIAGTSAVADTAAAGAGTGAAAGLGAGTLVADTGLMAGGAATGTLGAVGTGTAAATAGTTAAATGAATGAAAGTTSAIGATAAVPVVGWIAAAGLAIYSLGSMFDWW